MGVFLASEAVTGKEAVAGIDIASKGTLTGIETAAGKGAIADRTGGSGSTDKGSVNNITVDGNVIFGGKIATTGCFLSGVLLFLAIDGVDGVGGGGFFPCSISLTVCNILPAIGAAEWVDIGKNGDVLPGLSYPVKATVVT